MNIQIQNQLDSDDQHSFDKQGGEALSKIQQIVQGLQIAQRVKDELIETTQQNQVLRKQNYQLKSRIQGLFKEKQISDQRCCLMEELIEKKDQEIKQLEEIIRLKNKTQQSQSSSFLDITQSFQVKLESNAMNWLNMLFGKMTHLQQTHRHFITQKSLQFQAKVQSFESLLNKYKDLDLQFKQKHKSWNIAFDHRSQNHKRGQSEIQKLTSIRLINQVTIQKLKKQLEFLEDKSLKEQQRILELQALNKNLTQRLNKVNGPIRDMFQNQKQMQIKKFNEKYLNLRREILLERSRENPQNQFQPKAKKAFFR